MPEDEGGLQDEEKDRKLNLSLYKESDLPSIIYPPGKKACGHGKRRSDSSKKE